MTKSKKKIPTPKESLRSKLQKVGVKLTGYETYKELRRIEQKKRLVVIRHRNGEEDKRIEFIKKYSEREKQKTLKREKRKINLKGQKKDEATKNILKVNETKISEKKEDSFSLGSNEIKSKIQSNKLKLRNLGKSEVKKDNRKIDMTGTSKEEGFISPEANEIKSKIEPCEPKELSDKQLNEKIRSFSNSGFTRKTQTTIYERNIYIVEYSKRIAKGICQLCEKFAPFCDEDGEPYLEVHHIIWLSKGGKDNKENVVALCPTCHAKMHHSVGIIEDIAIISKKAKINASKFRDQHKSCK